MDYETLLSELHGLVGRPVAVMIGPMTRIDSEIPFVGRLRGHLGWASEEADLKDEEMLVF
jgi:hypothetical protein